MTHRPRPTKNSRSTHMNKVTATDATQSDLSPHLHLSPGYPGATPPLAKGRFMSPGYEMICGPTGRRGTTASQLRNQHVPGSNITGTGWDQLELRVV